jgi:hypothetical protein
MVPCCWRPTRLASAIVALSSVATWPKPRSAQEAPVLGLLVRQAVEHLQHQNHEHQHGGAGRVPARVLTWPCQRRIQFRTEQLEAHYGREALGQVALRRQSRIPLVVAEEAAGLSPARSAASRARKRPDAAAGERGRRAARVGRPGRPRSPNGRAPPDLGDAVRVRGASAHAGRAQQARPAAGRRTRGPAIAASPPRSPASPTDEPAADPAPSNQPSPSSKADGIQVRPTSSTGS